MLEFLDEEDSFRGKTSRKEPKSSRGSSGAKNFGRGRHVQPRPPSSQRAIVKVSPVRLANGGFERAKAHIKYLERDGVGKDSEPAQAFGKDKESVDLDAFVDRCADDRHYFRVILSPEFGEDLDLESYARDVMRRAEKDLKSKLEWAAVAHYNTDNPHVHLMIRGVDERGKDLVIQRDYIAHGLRDRAREVATYHLGPRTLEQIERARERDVTAERFTPLDRTILKLAQTRTVSTPETPGNKPPLILDLRVEHARKIPAQLRVRNQLLRRVEALEPLGLARQMKPNQWEISASLEPELKNLAIQKDIIRRMYAAHRHDPARWELESETPKPFVGRLIDRGLSDENKGLEYIIIEADDGRVHHIDDAIDAQFSARAKLRDIVDVGYDDKNKAIVERIGGPDLAKEAAYNGPVWLDRHLVENRIPETSQGFAGDLKAALKARRQVLESIGVVRPDGPVEPKILKVMRGRERKALLDSYAQKAGKAPVYLGQNEQIRGQISNPIQLKGGKYHLIEGTTKIALLPSDKDLRKHAGSQARISMKPDANGRMRPHVQPLEPDKGLER